MGSTLTVRNVAGSEAPSQNKELIARSREGDPEAWSVLVDKYKNLIFSIPIRYGLSREDAADIFQEVCMEWLKQLAYLRDPEALPKWLITVASHRCLHWRKYQSRTVSLVIEDTDPIDTRESTDSLRIIAESERDQLLRDAVISLPPRCRKLIAMLFFEETVRSYKEIAQDLKLAIGSIGFIRQRCLHKLRDRVQSIAPDGLEDSRGTLEFGGEAYQG
jgi:RNA polymerase sigma factor (sigma-70 family)